MKELLVLLRAMQLFSQNAHHLVKGPLFHQDHEFFGGVYEDVAKDFDDLSERIIGVYGEAPMHLQQLISAVSAKLVDAPSINIPDNKQYYEYLLKMEKKLCQLVEQIIAAGVDVGIEQLIGEQCNKSQARQYKISQRLK